MNVSLIELKKRYASLSDDELLYIAATSYLTEAATEAMLLELKKRKLDKELEVYAEELHEESQKIHEYDKQRGRTFNVIYLLLFSIIPAIVWLIKEW